MVSRPGPERRARERRQEVRSRLRLLNAERERILAELDRVLTGLAVVEDHLAVAQGRGGGQLGEQSWLLLVNAREDVSELRGRVLRTPLEAP